jgi:hypothetical protein
LLALAGGSLTAGLSGCGGDGTPTGTETASTDGTPTDTGTTSTGESPTDTVTPDEGTTTPTPQGSTETPTPGSGGGTPQQPLPDDQNAVLLIEEASITAGGSQTLTGTVVNPYLYPIQSIEVTFDPPGDGWSVMATGATSFDTIDTQESREVSWEITAPAEAGGAYDLEGTVRYETTTDAAEIPISVSVSVFGGDLAMGLAAHWGFDSGSVSDGTVSDQSDNGNDGSLVGDPTVVSEGAVGDALELGGAGEVVQVDHSDSLQVQTGDFTLAAWVKPQSTTDQQGIISKKTDDGVGDDQLAYQITLGGYGGLGGTGQALDPTFACNTGSELVASGAGQSLSADQWYHLAVTFDHEEATVEWYVDGSSTGTETLPGTPLTNEQELFLGAHFAAGGNPDSALAGVLDEVRIYDERKDGAFIGGLYAVGTPS